MAEHDAGASDNRTEEPTPRRRQKAREEGRIPRSQEFTAAVSLVAGTGLVATVGGATAAGHLLELFRSGPAWMVAAPGALSAAALLRVVLFEGVLGLLPLVLGVVLFAVGAGLVQSRGAASWKPLKPDLKRINPLSGFRRIFGADAALNFAKSVLKLVALGLVTYLVLRGAWPRFVALADAPALHSVTVLRSAVVRLGLTVGLAFLALGALDYVVQIFRTERQLRMTREEVLREHKEQEGDPQIKARIRQIARQRARQRMLTQVATADVVVTNPIHIAVALRYDPLRAQAPVVVAMGERKLAERIRKLAAAAGVPVVENRPLARALRAACTVGSPIPPALFVAVAEILAYVYRLRRRLPQPVATASGSAR